MSDNIDGDKLELLKDTKVEVRVVLGEAKMQIKDILRLGEGSLVELNKYHGESVNIYIANKLYAKGEVVSIDDNFGIRIKKFVKNHNESSES